MANLVQVTPFMHVENLDTAVAFFTDILGFAVGFRADNYAFVRREQVAFRLLEQCGPEGASEGAPPGNRRYAYYVDVRDVDALYAELKAKLDTLPPGDVKAPFDQPYEQRELLVLAPDGNLIAFGQDIRKR